VKIRNKSANEAEHLIILFFFDSNKTYFGLETNTTKL